MNNAISVIILAAGHSSRMNYPKSFLLFDNRRKFIEKIIDTYISSGIDDIILVINKSQEEKMRSILSKNYSSHQIKMVVNQFPEKGRFYSIQQGLKNINNKICFIQNIDNPFISKLLLNEMMKELTASNYVVPSYQNKNGHPVLLSNDVVQYLLNLKRDDYNLRHELNHFLKTKINWEDENILANINSWEEYQKYFEKKDKSISSNHFYDIQKKIIYA